MILVILLSSAYLDAFTNFANFGFFWANLDNFHELGQFLFANLDMFHDLGIVLQIWAMITKWSPIGHGW